MRRVAEEKGFLRCLQKGVYGFYAGLFNASLYIQEFRGNPTRKESKCETLVSGVKISESFRKGRGEWKS